MGPLIFVIYVNDLQNAYTLFYALTFADDTNLFVAASLIGSLCESVNSELEKVKTWLNCNRLSLNVSKTAYHLYTKRSFDISPDIRIDDISISRADNVKFLGVIVDEQLSFKPQIESVAKKLAVDIGFLHRGREVLDRKEQYLTHGFGCINGFNPISGRGGCFYPPLGFFLNISQTA